MVVDILENFRDEIPKALASAGEDPVERLKTAFRACCMVVDAKRAAVNLTYRESKTLTTEGLSQIMALEFETAEPIREVYRESVAAGASWTSTPDWSRTTYCSLPTAGPSSTGT